MKKQRGAAMVEFALIALLFFVILFGIIEFARAMFVYNALVEATRRGARVAAVCPPNNINGSTAKIKNVVLFNAPSATGNGLLGLTPSNVNIQYLLSNMTPWTYNPVTSANGTVVGNIDDIAYVQVSITGFQHYLIIPGFTTAFTIPTGATITTLPSESLGRMTANNPLAAANRNCF
jgi:Flp pilus assembly protein TadG